MGGAVAFVLKGYPRLSETFIAQEILGLEKAGLDIRIVSLRHPTDKATHPVNDEIQAPVTYLPEYLYQEIARLWRGWRTARKLPGYRTAFSIWWQDLKRDLTPNRIRRFGQALVLAAELPPQIDRLHAHFLHTPASVTRYAAIMTGLPWSVSAHARDIWTSPDWEITEKLKDCAWAVTCSHAAWLRLAQLAPDDYRVALVYHGIDLNRFDSAEPAQAAESSGPVRLLTVGRAVEKKGHDVLIKALARLPKSLDWHWTHIGGGELRKPLMQQAETAGISDRVTWLGAQPQARVLAEYRAADLFVLASRIARDNDRDGLPNVLLEAQSQSLPCVATDVSAIPELIRDGENGLLVAPDDAEALAEALAKMIRDPEARLAMGRAGRRIIEEKFSHVGGITQLAQKFGLPIARAGLAAE